MPVRSVKNQYLGVNAHLHSFWQGAGKWNRFQDFFVGKLMVSLKAQLLPMGYTAELEKSLQIRRDEGDPYRPVADVLVSDLDPERPRRPSHQVGNGWQQLAVAQLVPELIEEERHYSAVAVFEQSRSLNGDDAVAWIELLSPSNKRKGKDADVYQSKRATLLRKGIVFVEIDFLHETPPTFDTSQLQPQNEAHPYRVVVLDPRPDARSGPAFVREFDVDEPIPAMPIPLNGDDKVDFDFGMAYQLTFQEALYGYDRDYDYAEVPMNFERFSEADQTRIAHRMLSVLEAAGQGADLETGPFPVKDVSLAEALEQIEALKGQL